MVDILSTPMADIYFLMLIQQTDLRMKNEKMEKMKNGKTKIEKKKMKKEKHENIKNCEGTAMSFIPFSNISLLYDRKVAIRKVIHHETNLCACFRCTHLLQAYWSAALRTLMKESAARGRSPLNVYEIFDTIRLRES